MTAIQLCQLETNDKIVAFTDGSFEKFKVFVRKRGSFPQQNYLQPAIDKDP